MKSGIGVGADVFQLQPAEVESERINSVATAAQVVGRVVHILPHIVLILLI